MSRYSDKRGGGGQEVGWKCDTREEFLPMISRRPGGVFVFGVTFHILGGDGCNIRNFGVLGARNNEMTSRFLADWGEKCDIRDFGWTSVTLDSGGLDTQGKKQPPPKRIAHSSGWGSECHAFRGGGGVDPP